MQETGPKIYIQNIRVKVNKYKPYTWRTYGAVGGKR